MQLRIGIRTLGECPVASAWAKYLGRQLGVSAWALTEEQAPPEELNCVIAFSPLLTPTPGVKNVLYLQPAKELTDAFGGPVEAFSANKERFYAYVFASAGMMRQCKVNDGYVVPYGVDPELYYPDQDRAFAHSIVFRGDHTKATAKFIAPARSYGLAIYGKGWNGAFYGPEHEIRRAYSSSTLCLNVHTGEQKRTHTISPRVYEVLACGGRLISDEHDMLRLYGDRVIQTQGGDDLADLCRFYTRRPRLWPISTFSGEGFMRGISYESRMENLIEWLRGVL